MFQVLTAFLKPQPVSNIQVLAETERRNFSHNTVDIMKLAELLIRQVMEPVDTGR